MAPQFISMNSANTDDSTTEEPLLIAAVEGGGTAFKVTVCQLDQDVEKLPLVLYKTQVDSSQQDPQQCLAQIADFLIAHRPPQGYAALGIATFGPAGVRPDKPELYGKILPTTPKVAWRNVDILTPLKQACQAHPDKDLPVKMDTDVNASAFSEYIFERRRNQTLTSCAYVTVGTGVGAGMIINGAPVIGRMHPEVGHVPVQPLKGDTFDGYSWGKERNPFGGLNEVEGLASSVALTERYETMCGAPLGTMSREVLGTLPDDHELWDHAANALASCCATLLLTVSIEKIVFGGGVMKRKCLIEKVQQRTVEIINGYLDLPEDDMSSLICCSEYGDGAGMMGAIVMAQHTYLNSLKK